MDEDERDNDFEGVGSSESVLESLTKLLMLRVRRRLGVILSVALGCSFDVDLVALGEQDSVEDAVIELDQEN